MSDHVDAVTLSYPSADGISVVNAKIWTADQFGERVYAGGDQPKGIVQIIHGMAEHIDRYDDLASFLVNQGFVVCAEDHIGHGGTAPTPDDYGHMPVKGGKDVLLADVDALRKEMSSRFPDEPYIMYGHSMGSFILRAYLARHSQGLAAAILSGTGMLAPAMSAAGRSLAKIIATVRGPKHRSKLLDSMGAGGYGKQIKDARTPLDWLSTDDEVVDEYIADDRTGFMFTVGGYATLLDLTGEVASPQSAMSVPSDLPILFIAGDQDPVGANGEGVKAAAQLYRNAGLTDVEVILYPGMRHEVHNEIDKVQVYGDIARWLDEVLKTA